MISDLAWLSREAQTIHAIFTGMFYSVALTLLLLGVMMEFFKFPIGGVPSVAPLVGRVLIAAIMLHSYGEVSNFLSEITDALATKLGNLNEFHNVLSRMGDKLGEFSWSWTSFKETTTLILSFVTFFLLYVSIYIANAGVIYVWVLLYVFSPLLIALFILPSTASATKAMYRSLFEVCAWKIVWAVLATLLWSSALSEINKPSSDINFLTVIAFNLILAISVLFTPMVVHALTGAGLTAMATNMMGMAAGATAMSPGIIATGAIKSSVTKVIRTGAGQANAMRRNMFAKQHPKKTRKSARNNDSNSESNES